jgi:N-acetylmuramoyl-L-alanine amidase
VSSFQGYYGAVPVPSPNYDQGRSGQYVAGVVLHGTAGPNAEQWFAQPASRVSAHYVVRADATIIQCVSESDTAWHAGVVSVTSNLYRLPNPNLWTIGIEFERDTTNSAPMLLNQLVAGDELLNDIWSRYGWLSLWPHDAIDIGRTCPGPDFPLARYLDLLARIINR